MGETINPKSLTQDTSLLNGIIHYLYKSKYLIFTVTKAILKSRKGGCEIFLKLNNVKFRSISLTLT